MIPYAKQKISDKDREAVLASLNGDFITRGPLSQRFEEAISTYVEAPYTVLFNSGSSALNAAYFAAGASKEDRILTTPNSYIATISAGLNKGATLEFADIEKESGNLSLESLLPLLKQTHSRGKQIIVPVHFAGLALDMKRLFNAITDPNAVVIEDGAHALGSRYPTGEPVGCGLYSDMTIFSFHPAKTITAGEGGAVTTRSKEHYEKLLLFRNNGINKKPGSIWSYDVESLSSNFHLCEMQAALGLSQLSSIEEKIQKRKALMNRYYSLLDGVKGIKLLNKEGLERTAYHLCLARISFGQAGLTRDQFMQALWDQGVGTQLHYIPLYQHTAVKKKLSNVDCPEMEAYFLEALSLPLYEGMDFADVEKVVSLLQGMLTKSS